MCGFDALTASYFEFRVPGRSKSSTSSSSPSSLLLSSLLLLTNLERKCVSANLPNFSGKKKQRHNLAGGFFSINRDYEAIKYSMLSSIQLHHDFRTSSDVYNKAIITSY